MYAWKEAVSPHLAAERESGPVDDATVLQLLQSCLASGFGPNGGSEGAKTRAMCLVETAGGVASPGPSGSLQCDLYRCLYCSIIIPRSVLIILLVLHCPLSSIFKLRAELSVGKILPVAKMANPLIYVLFFIVYVYLKSIDELSNYD